MIVLALTATPSLPGERPQLLMTGTYHAGEVVVAPGSTWLAVVPQLNHGFVVEEAEVVVEAVTDPLVGEEGEASGLRVTAPSCFRTPLFLVRGVDSIQTGFFDTSIEYPTRLEINAPTPITVFSRRHYALVVECDPEAPTTVDDFMECPLLLVHELSRQVLATFTVYAPPEGPFQFASEAAPTVLWAGDIDRDGKLDLLLDLTYHSNVSAPTLFLSSGADKGTLVAEIASFVTTGC